MKFSAEEQLLRTQEAQTCSQEHGLPNLIEQCRSGVSTIWDSNLPWYTCSATLPASTASVLPLLKACIEHIAASLTERRRKGKGGTAP